MEASWGIRDQRRDKASYVGGVSLGPLAKLIAVRWGAAIVVQNQDNR